MKPDIESMTKKYTSVIIIVVLLAVLIIIRAALLMTLDRSKWSVVAKRFEVDSVKVLPQRGSILSDDRSVMVSSTPEYQLVFKYKGSSPTLEQQRIRNNMLRENMKIFCDSLHEILPLQRSDEFRRLLSEAMTRGERNVKRNEKTGYYTNLYVHGNQRLPYNKYKEVKEFIARREEQYNIYATFGGSGKEGKQIRQLWVDSLDVICEGLHKALPKASVKELRDSITKGISNPKKRQKLYSTYVNREQMEQIRKLPVIRLGRKGSGFTYTKTIIKSGLELDELMVRKNVYNNTAIRTLGQWSNAGLSNAKPRNGIELAYDSLLRGKPGVAHRRKVLNEYAEFVDVAPVNGCDVVTTLNLVIQDISEQALMRKMEEADADAGTVIVMKTSTGEIKALVNVARSASRGWLVDDNYALRRCIEPGSVFKPASLLVALEDKEITVDDSVDTGAGTKFFYGARMKDDIVEPHVKKIPQILQFSSNLGTMLVIDEHYVKKGKPLAFLKGLQRLHLTDNFQVLPEERNSKLRTEAEVKASNVNTLWMAIGYGSQIAPINLAAFYNAIANGGTMMKPYLVSEVSRDGKIIKKNEPEVVATIAGKEAVADVTKGLIAVVNGERGTGRQAKSEEFVVAGKTGTAQINEANGRVGYWVNFCGFFPADKPEYTCVVCINKKTAAGGGGGNSAPVFGEIARRVMAYEKTKEVVELKDSNAVFTPPLKQGNAQAAERVLDGMRMSKADSLIVPDPDIKSDVVPNVVGMGAKDAIYTMEKCGIHVRLNGIGKVYRQSIHPGASVGKGMIVELYLK
ncbi:MAG: PASTA domain-containing protein [Bacteroidaceae bacterium]|nr:PASTA domain-containing protein [Bacteroidaceae bacterium]